MCTDARLWLCLLSFMSVSQHEKPKVQNKQQSSCIESSCIASVR
jgi:hypothetical protein